MVLVCHAVFFQAQHTSRRACSPRSAGGEMAEEKEGKEEKEEKEEGEEVEFLNTTVTVSHLPSVQFPETTRPKGTRLVDR